MLGPRTNWNHERMGQSSRKRCWTRASVAATVEEPLDPGTRPYGVAFESVESWPATGIFCAAGPARAQFAPARKDELRNWRPLPLGMPSA